MFSNSISGILMFGLKLDRASTFLRNHYQTLKEKNWMIYGGKCKCMQEKKNFFQRGKNGWEAKSPMPEAPGNENHILSRNQFLSFKDYKWWRMENYFFNLV